MPIRDDIPLPKQNHAEPPERRFEIPAYQNEEFQEAFFGKLQELRIPRDDNGIVELRMSPLGKDRVTAPDSYLVEVTFTSRAIDPQWTKRSTVLDIMDVLDQYDPKHQEHEH